MSSCSVCGDMRSIEFCRICRKPLCPGHRAGTGDLSDGYFYFCIEEGSTCLGKGLFGGALVEGNLPTKVETHWRLKYRAPSIVYYGIGFGVGVALVAGCIYCLGWC